MKTLLQCFSALCILLVIQSCSETSVNPVNNNTTNPVKPALTNEFGTEWQLTHLYPAFGPAVALPFGKEFTIVFSDGAASGKADCNTFTAQFRLSGEDSIVFTDVAMTDQACSGPDYNNEFSTILVNARSYSIDGDELTISANDSSTDIGEMRFKRRDQVASTPDPIEMFTALNPLSAELRTDPFTFGPAQVTNLVLSVELAYSGGCADHLFRLIGDHRQIQLTPAEANVFLRHDAQNETCEAYITEVLEFDLEPLKQSYLAQTGTIPSGDVRLNVYGSDGFITVVFRF